MNDREVAEKGRKLAAEIISLNQVCDRSKMDAVELERLNRMVDAARGMLADTAEYDPSQDDKPFGL